MRTTDLFTDADKLNTLLHYMRGAERFSEIFQDLTRASNSWCPFTHRGIDVNADCYRANPRVQSMLNWAEKYVQCAKFLDANRYALEKMSASLSQLVSPERIGNHREFRELVKSFQSMVGFIEPDLSAKLDRISCEECVRLDEALVAFSNYCFTASVVMAVSAVESRLVELIRKKHQRLYSKELRRFTLGRLIQVFDESQYKEKKYANIKKLLPEKHKPLLLLLNQYRIFSVHPKGEEVTAQIAESILHLSFAFMLDKSTCPYSPAELKCVDAAG